MTQDAMSRAADAFVARARRAGIIPVVTVEDPADAVPLARALVAGGLPLIEITLRTPAALDSIRAIAGECPDAEVGAGTILDPAQAEAAIRAGARFIVSPGATDRLLDAAAGWGVPYLPGVATASEAMRAAERGFTFLKLFPAEAVGGVGLLKSLAAPLEGLRFCPTGGIDAAKAPLYRALPNVVCVGGSWMVPAAALKVRDWAAVTALAKAAAPQD
jgi:2-dehydro-3-deoxyphosphogluconate aldolase/(4S)-4-hydroxy-2-oxoglutarate aldolase